MQARIKENNDILVVDLIGRIDIEATVGFERACGQLAERKIVFDCTDLSFVGSNGIKPFLEAMSDLVENKQAQLKFCGVGSEFKKIFAASSLSHVEIYEDVNRAVDSFSHKVINPSMVGAQGDPRPWAEATVTTAPAEPVQVTQTTNTEGEDTKAC